MKTPIPPRSERRERIAQAMVDSTQIDELMIRDLVHTFYGRVRSDPILAPVFERVVAGNWDAHLARMCDFWSSVMLMSGRYNGNPMAAHLRLKEVKPAHFERWLALFVETAAHTCPPEAASAFIGRAQNIARSLQLGMFFRPGLSSKTMEKSDVSKTPRPA
jgi:hemoglobin